jgi:hypothetical protein
MDGLASKRKSTLGADITKVVKLLVDSPAVIGQFLSYDLVFRTTPQ